jgi:hypothetical protein
MLVYGCLDSNPPEPWLRWGYAFTDDGDSIFVRMEAPRGSPARLQLARYGERRVPFEDVSFGGDTSVVRFTWPGRVYNDCRLERVAPENWEGACRSADGGERRLAWPHPFRFNFGADLAPSPVDIDILQRARELLASEDNWNRSDDRACDDDISEERYSLFCALYRAQLDVTGHYKHHRPAMREPRRIIKRTLAERITVHGLRSINNHPATTLEEIVGILRESIAALSDSLEAPSDSADVMRH